HNVPCYPSDPCAVERDSPCPRCNGTAARVMRARLTNGSTTEVRSPRATGGDHVRGAAAINEIGRNTASHPTSQNGLLMILLWLLCVGLVLGRLLASLLHRVPSGTWQLWQARKVPVPAPAPRLLTRTRARRPRGRTPPPAACWRAGPPGPFGGVG